MTGFFLKTYRFFRGRKIFFWVLLLSVMVGLTFLASRISFEEDISALLPKSEENETLQKVLETSNFSDKIIVHLQRSEDGTTDDLTELATAFLDSLKPHQSQYVSVIQGQVSEDDAFETLDFVYENLPLFLTDQDYETVQQKLGKDSLTKINEQNFQTLVAPSGMIAKETILRDPLGLSILGVNNLKEFGFKGDFKIKNGFVISEDEQHLLLFITPKFSSSETAPNTEFAEILYKIENNLNKEFKNRASLSYFGGSLIAVANAQQIERDIQLTVGIALLVLLVFLIVFYRRLYLPIVLLLPTAFGALLAIAVLLVARGEISAISLGVGSVLLGVTLDFSLHILTHIRNHGTGEHLFRDITKPILMSGLSTALAFLCLLFTGSQVLKDLGVFASISVLGASIFALITIPQLYHGNIKTKPKKSVLDHIANYPFQKNKMLVGAILVVAIASIFTFQNVKFNKDLSQLNFVPEAIQKTEKDLDVLLNTTSKSVYVVAYGEHLEEALKANDRTFQTLKKLKRDTTVISFNSLGAVVNSDSFQRKKIEKWDDFWTEAKTENLLAEITESGQKLGFKPKTYTQLSTLLQKDFETISISEFNEIETIPVSDFVSEKQGLVTVSTLVKISEENVEDLKTSFSNSENILVIDRQGLNESLLSNLKDTFNKLILYCSLVVALLLFLFYRNWKIALITLMPIVLTWWITLGLMGLFGLEFNIFNIIVSSFVFGLGVDYAIFVTNGLLSEDKNAMTTYRTSILLSILTTLLGMGVLIFAKHPALHSLAAVAVTGIFTAMVVSFAVQPLLFSIVVKNRKASEG